MGEKLKQDPRLDYIDDLTEKYLQQEGLVNHRNMEIMPPPYSVGTFNSRGEPLQEKSKYMFEKILNGSATVNVLEGGVRGGKDVFGINVWSKLLMMSSERLHLALGSSLEHALKTIFDSNGFGLKYLIPHGEFVRNSEDGGIRGVFKFKNIYGKDREVHFYGNAKKNDFQKYQGFTFGTVYINEGINQHINGILEAQQRTATSKDRKIIVTQNPVGTSHVFYTEFEAVHMLQEVEKKFIENLQEDRLVYLKWKIFLKQEREKSKKVALQYVKKRLDFLTKSVPNINGKDLNQQLANVLTVNELEELYGDLFDINVELEQREYEYTDENGDTKVEYGIMSIPIEEFVELPEELTKLDSPKLIGSSMYKLMLYDRGLENINEVENGYDYNYFHYTMRDNIGMSTMQINDYTKGYDRTSAIYKQRYLGERVSSDGQLFPEFSDSNILTNDIEFYEQNPNTLRVIAIDPGANHPTAIVDAEVDLSEGMAYVLGEAKVDLIEINPNNRSFLKIEEELWKVIRARKGRRLPDMLIIDPSNPFLIDYFSVRGFTTVAANNRTQSAKSRELVEGHKGLKRDTKGVDLIKAGLMKLKFLFHESCVETIKEIQGMAVVFNENTGNDDIIKMNDDMFDAFKYIVNTAGIDPTMWQESEVLNEYERGLSENEKTKDTGRNLDRRETRQDRLERLIQKRNRSKEGVKGQIGLGKKWYER